MATVVAEIELLIQSAEDLTITRVSRSYFNEDHRRSAYNIYL